MAPYDGMEKEPVVLLQILWWLVPNEPLRFTWRHIARNSSRVAIQKLNIFRLLSIVLPINTIDKAPRGIRFTNSRTNISIFTNSRTIFLLFTDHEWYSFHFSRIHKQKKSIPVCTNADGGGCPYEYWPIFFETKFVFLTRSKAKKKVPLFSVTWQKNLWVGFFL